MAAVCHDLYALLVSVVGQQPWPVRIWDLGHPGVFMMGFRKGGLPAVAERGRMTFCTDVPTGLAAQGTGCIPSSIEWTRRSGEGEAWQWCGWHHGHVPLDRWIRVSVWVKFLDRVPPASADFGIRVHGRVHSGWLDGLTPDTWHYVWVDVPSAEGQASSDDVLLTFNSVPGPQTVRFADLALEVFNSRPLGPTLTGGALEMFH